MAIVTTDDKNYKNIAAAIRAKNGSEEAYAPDQMAQAIEALSADQVGTLIPKKLTPTGEELVVLPDPGTDGFSSVTVAGDAGLKPDNLRKGVTIYGVTGILESGLPMPAAYESAMASAKAAYEAYTTEPYTGWAYLLDGEYQSVIFMLPGFTVTGFDPVTTKMTLLRCVVVGQALADGSIWSYHDYRAAPSAGEHFAKNIRYATCYVNFGESALFPVGAPGSGRLLVEQKATNPVPPRSAAENTAPALANLFSVTQSAVGELT